MLMCVTSCTLAITMSQVCRARKSGKWGPDGWFRAPASASSGRQSVKVLGARSGARDLERIAPFTPARSSPPSVAPRLPVAARSPMSGASDDRNVHGVAQELTDARLENAWASG